VKVPPFHWWRTVFFLIPTLAIATAILGTLSLVSGLVDSQGRMAHACAQAWSRWLLWTAGVTIDHQGVAEPPASTSCVFVANHSSHYDTPILFTALPRQLRIIAKVETLGRIPFIGWHLRRAGHLLVDRNNPGASVMKKMQRMVAQGASLLLYPEGSRTKDGQVGRFKGGAFLLAIETGLPIVPVSVSGSRVVMPKDRLMVCPATVRVTVHEPIATAGLTRHDARALAERVREVVAKDVDATLV
jgi:1-acyl-sn-glycerol-3-phosphate acyltransferase